MTIELTDGRAAPRAVVFVGARFIPHDELLTSLGCHIGDDGSVATDATGRTSVPGV